MDVIKIALLSIVGVMTALQFKVKNQEYGYYICFAIGIIIFAASIDRLRIVLSGMEQVGELLGGYSEYLGILLKVVGITYICEFCSGICKDAGYGQIAVQVEVFGKLTILISGMPIIMALLNTILSF
ncbi:MAG: stage III sporulation protein AD [Lachnospiraceae bacterium]|nr:stage III sporulation protein AD [Lachnospiraceae bacterium]MBR3684429.1 stage III sporulation protein AD [Lachnospiraceae bacterium]